MTEAIAIDLGMEYHAHLFDHALFAAGYEVRHNTLSKRTEWRVPLTWTKGTWRMPANGSRGTDRSAATARHALAEVRHGLPLRTTAGRLTT